jgi:hypothetical protein
MIPMDVFRSESVAADLIQQVCWRDGDYRRRIVASQRLVSHSISERSISGGNSTSNPAEKRSNTLSKPFSEFNNV